MAGYTPLFSSLTTGTLCGRWPDIGLWPIVLSLSDREGVVDVTPTYLAGVTGLAVDEVVACMRRFCQPDPYSRSPKDAGARLVLLDAHREWGWKIVNHGVYREKARLMAREIERVNSGENKARMQRRRPPMTPDDPRSPPLTTADPPSDSDSDSDSDKRRDPPGDRGVQGGMRATRAPTAQRLPMDFNLDDQRREIARKEGADPEREFAKFTDHWRAASGANARKHDWDAAWRNWCRKAKDMQRMHAPKQPYTESPTTEELEAREAAHAGK